MAVRDKPDRFLSSTRNTCFSTRILRRSALNALSTIPQSLQSVTDTMYLATVNLSTEGSNFEGFNVNFDPNIVKICKGIAIIMWLYAAFTIALRLLKSPTDEGGDSKFPKGKVITALVAGILLFDLPTLVKVINFLARMVSSAVNLFTSSMDG